LNALKGIMGWVRLHPYNIAQKVQIVVEHFRELVAPLLKGHGKAMVVVRSRKEAVRWQLAIDRYIKDRGYPIRTRSRDYRSRKAHRVPAEHVAQAGSR
jgi:type I restriction enzyme R subunit